MGRMDSSSAAAAASASGSSGGSTGEAAADQRKRKRMLSNRESARRSRQRKQRHLDDLAAQAAHLRRENARALAALAATARGFLAVESENAVLRAQAAELATRLRSLDDILLYVSASGDGTVATCEPWNQPAGNVALADMFQYC